MRDGGVRRGVPREVGECRADAAGGRSARRKVSRTIDPQSPLLFQFSALTYNAHRIHYDRDYATKVEGYPGLLVHGPLLATLLVDLFRRHKPGGSQ